MTEEKPMASHTATTEKPLSRVDFYRNNSTLSKSDVIQLVIQAPTVEEASRLFTEKWEELKLKDE